MPNRGGKAKRDIKKEEEGRGFIQQESGKISPNRQRSPPHRLSHKESEKTVNNGNDSDEETLKNTEHEDEDMYLENKSLKNEVQFMKLKNDVLQQELNEVTRRVAELEKKVKILERAEKSDKAEIFQKIFDTCSLQMISSLSDIIEKKNQEMKAQLVEESTSLIQKQFETKMGELQKDTERELTQKQEVNERIKEEVTEQQVRISNAKKIRIGGIDRDWWKEREKEKEPNLIGNLKELIPNIKWNINVIKGVIRMGNHLSVTFVDEEDRIDILKQASKLRGTKFWIAEELTRKQLELKSTELEKVRIARAEGKWAVYRNGGALIRTFKTK